MTDKFTNRFTNYSWLPLDANESEEFVLPPPVISRYRLGRKSNEPSSIVAGRLLLAFTILSVLLYGAFASSSPAMKRECIAALFFWGTLAGLHYLTQWRRIKD